MQQEDNRKSESSNLTPEKLQRTPRDGGSIRRDASHSEERSKRRIHYTPYNSPEKYSKTPQSSGSFRKEVMKSQLDSNKRKIQSTHNESLEKIPKTDQGSKFVNTLISQWSKHMGVQTPLSQAAKQAQESPMSEEIRGKCSVEEKKIQKLQKKLQAAEETISSLSVAHEAEVKAKEEILQQLNSDWESITKYYYEISESLKQFQQHKDNLSELYNNVILMQQSTVKRLQQELSSMRLKDDEHKNIITGIESKVSQQEKRIQEMLTVEAELKKQLDDVKKKSIVEKDQLHNIHAEEKLELMKKQDKLTSINNDLQVQLQKIEQEKQGLSNLFVEKDEKITKLQEQIVACKNKEQDLLHRSTELSLKYEESIRKEEELRTQLELKVQEINRLQEHIKARQEIESSLTKDLDLIDSKYKTMQDDLLNLKNKLNEAQVRNSDLETSLENMKYNNQQKITELNKTIKSLEEENNRVLSEKRSKIQELENTCKLLRERHEKEITSLKNEFEIERAEMRKTIDMQNSAFTKLNDTLNKMNETNQIKEKYYHAKENHDKLQDRLNQKSQSIVESNLSQMKISESHEIEEQQLQENIATQKVAFKNKNDISDSKKQDIYTFSTKSQQNISPMKQNKFNFSSSMKVSDSVEKYSSYLSQSKNLMQSFTKSQENKERINEDLINATQKKKIFKTRSTGLKQYGTPRKILKK
nr:PREDICTED: putative leucine-rich repeat-containing protein DDB_G0290503 isoform X1 [Megachile rotundata]